MPRRNDVPRFSQAQVTVGMHPYRTVGVPGIIHTAGHIRPPSQQRLPIFFKFTLQLYVDNDGPGVRVKGDRGCMTEPTFLAP